MNRRPIRPTPARYGFARDYNSCSPRPPSTARDHGGGLKPPPTTTAAAPKPPPSTSRRRNRRYKRTSISLYPILRPRVVQAVNDLTASNSRCIVVRRRCGRLPTRPPWCCPHLSVDRREQGGEGGGE
ncbi:hypothetical protein NL676_026048 [Syzygium grande]|nr:hypothetical protein NL676_026048 [Syzygium grande]